MFSLDGETVSALSWTYAEEEIAFIDGGSGWNYKEDSNFPVDSTILDSMVSALSRITSTKKIESVEDYAQYGLDEPACTINVTAGTDNQLCIGDETGLGGERYLTNGDGNVYLVDAGIIDSFTYGLYDLVQEETIPTIENVTNVTLESDTQNYSIVYLQDSGIAYSDEYVWFMCSGEEYVTLDTELTESFLSTVTAMSWASCENYHADEVALSEYGLDEPTAVITVDYVETTQVETGKTDDEGNEVYETQKNDAQFILEIGGYYSDSYCYARLAGSSMVYLIDAAISNTLLYTTYESLQPDEVLLMDWETVTALDMVLDGETYHIQKDVVENTDEEGSTTEKTVYTLDGDEIDFAGILDELNSLSSSGSASGITPERSEEISFLFYRNTENFAQMKLTFYQYDSSTCLVSLDGEIRQFASRSAVIAIVEEINQLILD